MYRNSQAEEIVMQNILNIYDKKKSNILRANKMAAASYGAIFKQHDK